MAKTIRISDDIPEVIPKQRLSLHNLAIASASDILETALSPLNPTAILRFMVSVDTAGVFSARIIRSGNTQSVDFNSGANLVANSAYMFDLLVHNGDKVNFRHSAAGTLLVFRATEVPSVE